MPITRRGLLGSGIAAGTLLALDPGITGLAFAEDGGAPSLLVVVHLRGGCDGLNFISPANDPDFIAARNPDLRVSADGPDAGHELPRGPDPRTDFRLHPSAGGLADLYQGGHLAFLHAVGLTDATRSHFVATDMIEHGVAGGAALARSDSGWIARYQRMLSSGNPGIGAQGLAIATSAAPSGEFEGLASALAVTGLEGGFGAPGGAQIEDTLRRFYANRSDPVGLAGRDALGAMQLIDRRIQRDAKNHPVAYDPEHNVDYQPAGDLARPLRTVAQLAKMEIGLRIATVDIGGWDTHDNQTGRFRNCVERLSAGISAFYDDMWRYHDRLIMVTVTEFGRRLRSNRSNGTDHGRAAVMAVLGGNVAGGRFYGGWPGLKSDALDEGVDLAVATDYRQVLGEVLNAHNPGTSLTGVFPDYRYPGPLGMFTPL